MHRAPPQRAPEPTPLRNLLDWALVAAPLGVGLAVAAVLAALG